MDLQHVDMQDVSLSLSEFLREAELEHYCEGFRNFLKIMNTSQLKYVTRSDLTQLGMSRPEQRRFKKNISKYFRNGYLHKIKKLFRPSKLYKTMPSAILVERNACAGSPLSEYKVKVPAKHMIPVEDICINNELGAGEFGVVQQGTWTNDNQRIQVAIKCLGQERMQTSSMEFLKEAAVMHSIEHPNVVRLYGVVLHPDSLMLVTELAPLRSLLECLKEFSLRLSFPVLTLCQFASQICDGMTYLENKRLIHRDLAARNILVFSKNKVKISDFGLSRALGVGKDYYQTNYNVNLKLPIAWCAPECITYLRFTSSSDVWAFAVTLWEMFSYGFQPWAAFSGQQILAAIDEPNYQRLEQPDCCPDSFYQLMLECWSHDPNKRPKFAEIAPRLPELYPDQLEATISSPKDVQQLEFQSGDIITVLKKHCSNGLWKGVLNNGKTGYFSPSCARPHQTTMKRIFRKLRDRMHNDGREGTSESSENATCGRGRDSSQRFFPSEMFESPNTAVVSPYRTRRIEKMPLLNAGTSTGEPSSPPAFSSTSGGVGDPYGRDPSGRAESVASDPPHEYSEISDEDMRIELRRLNELECRATSPDRQRALSANVMAEVDSMLRNLYTDFKSATEPRRGHGRKFKTLTLGRRSTRQLVQPISSNEEKALERHIAMTKELMARSMNELDHPKTPTSPSNEKGKNKFRFPSLSSHDKESAKGSHQRNFSEIVNQVPDLQSFLTEAARVAYASLIERREKNNVEITLDESVSLPDSPMSMKIELLFPKMKSKNTFDTPEVQVTTSDCGKSTTSFAPPPIPPRDPAKNLNAPKTRHERKHELTLPFEEQSIAYPEWRPMFKKMDPSFKECLEYAKKLKEMEERVRQYRKPMQGDLQVQSKNALLTPEPTRRLSPIQSAVCSSSCGDLPINWGANDTKAEMPSHPDDPPAKAVPIYQNVTLPSKNRQPAVK